MQHELDRKKTVIMKDNTKRRMKKQQTIEKKIMNKIMLKIMNWTKKYSNTEIKKTRNKREHKISGFPHKPTLDSGVSRLLHGVNWLQFTDVSKRRIGFLRCSHTKRNDGAKVCYRQERERCARKKFPGVWRIGSIYVALHHISKAGPLSRTDLCRDPTHMYCTSHSSRTQIVRLQRPPETSVNFNQLTFPFSPEVPDYRRGA
jgi:hypothetical protein